MVSISIPNAGKVTAPMSNANVPNATVLNAVAPNKVLAVADVKSKDENIPPTITIYKC